MSETFSDLEWHLDIGIQTWSPQVDNFSKELSDFLSDDKFTNKEQISNILKLNSDLKNGFEEFLKTANNRLKIKCKKDLQNCKTEEEIKSIILENLPEWYKIWNTDVVENEEIWWDEWVDSESSLIDITDQADQDEEKANQDEEKADQKIEQADQNKKLENAKEKMILAYEYRDFLADLYPNLNDKTWPWTDLYEQTKVKLQEQWLLENVNVIWEKLWDKDFVNKYILLQATLKELKTNSTDYDKNHISYFDKVVKDLNNSCNIPDTNFDSFSGENISQTRTELFNSDIWNESLIKAKESNRSSRDYSEVFQEMWFEEALAKYGRFLQGDLKEFYNQYKNNPEIRDKISWMRSNSNPTDEDIQLYNKYNELYWALMWKEWQPWIKDTMENQTKDLMEELCIISQIKWMYMCMWKDLWNDFDLNKANEIQSDNWVLILNGHIDGVNFAIRQDTNNPEARLQTSLKLNKSPDWNSFTIWWENNFVDSNFILPSQNEVFATIKETVKSWISLEDYDNPSEYFENLQSTIMWNMTEKYADTQYVHHYMKDKVQGEKVVDSATWLIQKIKPSEDFSKPINQANSGKMYDFMKIINFNIENSTADEKDKLNQCISKIWDITDSYRQNNWNDGWFKYPPIIENFLKNKTWLAWWNEENRLWLVFDLFSFYNEHSQDTRSNKEWTDWVPSKIVINDLYRDLIESSNDNNESQQSLVSVQRNESNDNLVASIDSDDFNWPSDWYSSQTVVESWTSVA